MGGGHSQVREAGQHLPFFDRPFLNPRFLLRLDDAVAPGVGRETRESLRKLLLVDRAAELARHALMGDRRAAGELLTFLEPWLDRPCASKGQAPAAGAHGHEGAQQHPSATRKPVEEDPFRHLYASGPVLDVALSAVRLTVGDKGSMCQVLEAAIAFVEEVALRAAAVATALTLARTSPELRRILRASIDATPLSLPSAPRGDGEVGPRHMTLPALFDFLHALHGWEKDNAQLRYATLAMPRPIASAEVVQVTDLHDRVLEIDANGSDAVWCGNHILETHAVGHHVHAVVPALRGGRLVAARRLDDAEVGALEKAHHEDGQVSPLGWNEALAGRIHPGDLAPPSAPGPGVVVDSFGWRFRRFEVYDRHGALVGGLGLPPADLDPAEPYRVRWNIIGNATITPIHGHLSIPFLSPIWHDLFDNPLVVGLFRWPKIFVRNISACVRRGLPASLRLGAADGATISSVTPPIPEGVSLSVRDADGEMILDVDVSVSAVGPGYSGTVILPGRTRSLSLGLELAFVADLGRWMPGNAGPTGADLGVVASHAALLPGREREPDDTMVMFFGYDEDHRNEEDKGEYQLWNPATRAPHMPTPPPFAENFTHLHSPFCSAHAYLADGDLLVVGGHIAHDTYDGGPAAKTVHRVRRSPLGDGFMADWIDLPGMEDDRWYPTVVTLATGKVMILGGSSQFLANPWNGTNEDYELFNPNPFDHLESPFSEVAHDPHTFTRDEPSTPERDDRHTSAFDDFSWTSRVVGLYSHAHLLPANTPEGLIYIMTEFIGRVYDPALNGYLADPSVFPTTIRALRVDTQGYRTWHNQGSSVLLPIDIDATGATPPAVRIMHVGGGTMGRNDDHENARRDAVVVRYDVSARNLSIESFLDIGGRRFMGDAVLLPTGEVLIVNGAEEGYTNNNSHPTRTPLLIRSDRSTSGTDAPIFSVKAPEEPAATTERRYHSSSCLLPDGAVVVAGSSGGWEPREDDEKFNVEIYEPWYFGCQGRPQIVVWPSHLAYGESFQVEANTEQLQGFVVLLRFSSVTHSLNTDQRLLRIETHRRARRSLRFNVPADRTVAPPGPYLLYVIDAGGFPSSGKVVFLS
jgi:hypothetical protein